MQRRWLRPAGIAAVLVALVAIVAVQMGSGQVSDFEAGATRSSSQAAKGAGEMAMDAAAPAPRAPAAAPAPAPAAPAAEGRPSASGSMPGGPGVGGGPLGGGLAMAGLDASLGRKIILNADLQLRVKNAREAMGELQRIADINRGFVADSRLSGTDRDGWQARVVLRIPAGNFGTAYGDITKLGELRDERRWTQDVTEEFVDLEARLKILQQQEESLLGLAARAEKFEDWSRLTEMLNRTRVEIEQIKGRQRVLGDRVELSTINVSLVQPPAGAPVAGSTPETLWGRMAQAFRQSAWAVLASVENLLVGLVALVPTLVTLALLALVLWPFARRLRMAWSRQRELPTPPPPPTPPGPTS